MKKIHKSCFFMFMIDNIIPVSIALTFTSSQNCFFHFHLRKKKYKELQNIPESDSELSSLSSSEDLLLFLAFTLSFVTLSPILSILWRFREGLGGFLGSKQLGLNLLWIFRVSSCKNSSLQILQVGKFSFSSTGF